MKRASRDRLLKPATVPLEKPMDETPTEKGGQSFFFSYD
jgi:hypothetical protein